MGVFCTLFIFVSSVIINPLSAQVLKGRVTNEAGEAVQYATVYIQELRQGTTANIKGDYELKLAPGKYQVMFQSLGYGPVVQTITITSQPMVRDVVLPLQYYMIPEVRISATGEDPAYSIMRKAIGMAPYYLNNISYYKAEVYLKGNVIVNKIPGVFKKLMKKAAKEEEKDGGTPVIIKEGDVYLMESVNEMEFTAPDKWNQKVISINSTFPDADENVSPMDYINASFYQPLVGNMAISPLAPQAFSYYKFQYLGATPQGNVTINKIRVIPKMKSQQLFEGIIYIIEDLWCIQSLDLTNDNMMGKVSIQQLYIPVRDEIWMPVSYKFVINISILGARADVEYGGSVKYLEVRPNTSLKKPESVTADFYNVQNQATPEIPVSKSQQKIEEILKKDEMNNRDMIKLSKLMDEESRKAQPDSVKNNLEIKDNVNSSVEKDAGKKDSTYWAEVRPIPLSDVEVKSIRLRDSTKAETSLRKSRILTDSIPGTQKKPRSKFVKGVGYIVNGHTWRDTTGISFFFDGLINMESLSFNTVDGFKYGTNFRFTKSWKNGNSLTISPDLKWTFSRESLNWRVNGGYNFNRMKNRSLTFGTGMISRDISNGGSINSFLNSINTLFFETNYLKLYESRYFYASYRSEIVNGLSITIFGGYEDRRVLQNTTSYSFINTQREYTPNVPVNRYLDSTANSIMGIRDQQHLEFGATAVYTPRQRYSIRNGTKINRGSDWPTFGLTWKHGINEFAEMTDRFGHYDMIRLDISRRNEMGAFSELNWRIRTGGFLNNSYVTYYDFFHFNAQPLPVLLDNYSDAFRLPAYYSLSTPEFFGEAHITYTTPYLFLKYLPGLSKTLMRENVSISYLGSRYKRNYTEVGYSISQVFFVGELGVYVGFEDLKFRSVGAKLVLNIN
jgi:hypothetical protein